MDFNWASFTKRININAPIAAIYRMWATREGIESWFLRQSLYMDSNGTPLPPDVPVQMGNRYTWLWHGWPDETVEHGEIVDANGTDALSFTFGQVGTETMVCTVRIYEELGQTICELVQQNIPVDEKSKIYYHLGCNTGWTFYMANLRFEERYKRLNKST
jgi:uncharacterized protein YndB with AHSA1/START domain